MFSRNNLYHMIGIGLAGAALAVAIIDGGILKRKISDAHGDIRKLPTAPVVIVQKEPAVRVAPAASAPIIRTVVTRSTATDSAEQKKLFKKPVTTTVRCPREDGVYFDRVSQTCKDKKLVPTNAPYTQAP